MSSSRLLVALLGGAAAVAGVVVLVIGIVGEDRVLLGLGAVLLLLALVGAGLLVLRYLRHIAGVVDGLRSELSATRKTVRQLQQETKARANKWDTQQRHDVVRDVAALLTLHDLGVAGREPFPVTGWSALPTTVAFLAEAVRALPPGALVADLGSGASTLAMALAAKQDNPSVRVISFDHDPRFAEVTRAALERHGVAEQVDLRVGPLEPLTTSRGEQLWYPRRNWEDLAGLSLVFVDGPPGYTGPVARMPFIDALVSRLAPGALVVLDDTHRADEREIRDALLALELPNGRPELVGERERTAIIRVP